MDADGSNQEPVTHGDFHDWFPHISPDGKWIVFLSFLKEEVTHYGAKKIILKNKQTGKISEKVLES